MIYNTFIRHRNSNLIFTAQMESFTEQINDNKGNRSIITLFITIDVNIVHTEHVRYYYYKQIINL